MGKRLASIWSTSTFPARSIIIAVCIALAALTVGGCAAPQQFTKGDPAPLTVNQQAAVQSVFSTPKRIAVLVGIDNFDDAKWSALRYTAKDAHDLAAVLNDTRYGRFDQVVTLTSSEETTKARILEALDQLARHNISQNDTVVFYISTHGTLARTDNGTLRQYLVTRDTDYNRIPETALDVAALKTRLGQLTSKKKLMILASCHSGRGKSQLSEGLLAELSTLKAPFFVKPLEDASEATIVLAASAWGETAREDTSLQNDVYTHFLIEGIKRHDRNSDGAVTVTEAHDYAKQQTYYITKGEQRPSMESIITGHDPIILSGEIVRSGKPVLYDYSRRYENMVVFVNGEKKGSLPLGVAIEPGSHEVELRNMDGTKTLYAERFSVKSGEQVSIPLLIHGYDQGASFRLGYQGFLNDKVDKSISKPLLMFGLAYSNNAYFSRNLGYRFDLSYGSDSQRLVVDRRAVSADVSQVSAGASLLYRKKIASLALYAGPRVGVLMLSRNLSVIGNESSSAASAGAITGLHLRYKKDVSFALEGSLNYASIAVGSTNENSFYYNVFGNLSVNF